MADASYLNFGKTYFLRSERMCFLCGDAFFMRPTDTHTYTQAEALGKNLLNAK